MKKNLASLILVATIVLTWGSTALAALKAGRRFVGCETNPDYVNLAEQRIFIELSTASPYTTGSPQTGQRVPYYRSDDAYTVALWAALREREVLFSIGSDTHADLAEVANIADAQAFLRERGWEDRLVTAHYWR